MRRGPVASPMLWLVAGLWTLLQKQNPGRGVSGPWPLAPGPWPLAPGPWPLASSTPFELDAMA